MKGLTTFEKLLVGFALVLAVGFMTLMNNLSPYKRYRLPTGDVVECKQFEETSTGNYALRDCKNGSDYYVQGTIEVLE